MRVGIRLQLVLTFGSLLVLAFVPLLFAVASLTRATFGVLESRTALAVGRAVAAHVVQTDAGGAKVKARDLLPAPSGASPADPVLAVGLYDQEGRLVDSAGDAAAAKWLPEVVSSGVERVRPLRADGSRRHLVVTPVGVVNSAPAQAAGSIPAARSVGVIVRADSPTLPSTTLLRIVALYMGTVAVALLAFLYFAATRLVVDPILALSLAARRVADGARALTLPASPRGARELVDLAFSLERMTSRLRADEEALREKVTEVSRYARDLAVAQNNLVRSARLASVGTLAAGLAHELGNPIAAILGFQELLLGGELSEQERQDFLVRMHRETLRVHRVLRNLLDFARPTSMRLQGRTVDPSTQSALTSVTSVTEAVDEVLALVQPQRALRNVTFAAHVAEDTPRVRMTHGDLVQVLLNLLLNAADAVPASGGQVLVEAGRLEGDGARGRVQIAVLDNGVGIASEIESRLFEPFTTTKATGQGTGLGLAVCRGLVEGAGGAISLAPCRLGGACFLIQLPAGEAAPI
jgi:signal transduction histidine kinase